MIENNIYIVPDVHCRDFYKSVLKIKDKPIVFLGDYMDSYRQEGTNDEQGIANLEEIFDFARENDNVTLLVGNHDTSWIWSPMGFERTDSSLYNDLHNLYRENIDLLHSYCLIGNVLFTHAGISDFWISSVNNNYYLDGEFKVDSKNVLDWIDNEWLSELQKDRAIRHWGYYELESPIFWCGSSRWGTDPEGGPLWRDHDEDDYPIKDFPYIRIYGHTRCEEIGLVRTSKVGHCIDSRAIFEYNLDTKTLKVSELNENR